MSTAATEALPAALPRRTDGLPALRLLPAPSCEPPYDDERTDLPPLRLVPTGPLLAPLSLVPAVRPAVVPEVSPAVIPVTDEDLDDDEREQRADALARRTSAALPAPRRFAHALLQRLVEVQAGVRPLGQLQRDLTFAAYEALEQHYSATERTPGPRPTSRAVRSVHVQARPEGVAEVCATVERGSRLVAVALRLEGRDGAWRCTDLVGV